MLAGRTRECARIDELLADAARGRSGALVLHGDPGTGKSALLSYAAERAAGYRILTATGAEPDSDFAFSALHEVLYPILDRLDQIPEVQARALEGALALAEAPGVGRMYVGAAALGLLAAAATDGPVLCVIDDAQWLDPASADALTFAARRLEAEGVVMIFAATSGEPQFRVAGLAEIEVGGLDAADAALLLRELVPTIADDVLARLIDVTRGNSMALTELPTLISEPQLAGREALPYPLPVGRRLIGSLAARTKEMTDPAKDALLLAAASSTDAMRVIAAPEGDVPQALEEAEALGILELDGGRLRFTHPLVRAAIYHSASPVERRAVHRRLAELLRDEPRYRERRAWHLAAAATGPDEDVAREVEEIARDTEDRRAHVNAAALFERAADLSLDDELRARRLVGGASASRLAGHTERAALLAGRALETSKDPAIRAEARIVRGLVSLDSGRDIDPAETLADVEPAAEADPARASRLLAVISESSSGEESLRIARRAAAIAPPGTSAEAFAAVAEVRALAKNGHLDRAAERIDDAARLLRASPTLADDPEILMAVVDGLADVGAEEAVVEELLLVASAKAREHTLVVLPRALLHRSYLEHSRGAWRDAYVHAFEATRLFEETGQPRRALPARAWLGLLEAWFGHEEEATAIAAGLRGAPGDRGALERAADRIEGVAALACGRAERAAGPLRRWVEGSAPALLPASPMDVADAVEAALHVGEAVSASGLISAIAAGDLTSSACRAWVDGMLAETAPSAAEAFDAALATAEDLPAPRPFLSARIALSSGERLRRDGKRVRARERLHDALERFGGIEAEPWAERARLELRATGERVDPGSRSRLGDLTPQELQVARLIAGGATYKEAAARLFLTSKTIEFHLGKVYRKLGVRGGRELAALYAREEFET